MNTRNSDSTQDADASLSPLEQEIVAVLAESNTDTPDFRQKVDFVFEHCEKKLMAVLAIRKNLQQKIVYLLSYGFAFIAFSILHIVSCIQGGQHHYLVIYIIVVDALYVLNIRDIVKWGFFADRLGIGLPGIDPENICNRAALGQNLPSLKLKLLSDYQNKICENIRQDNRLNGLIKKAVHHYFWSIFFPIGILYYGMVACCKKLDS